MEDINSAISKEVELQLEKEKLIQVLEIIAQETAKTVKSRQNFLDELLQYRRRFIEDYRDDEDKVIEYFDHERFVTEEAFNLMDSKLKDLNSLKINPYFGRIDFREDEEGIEVIYIGRFGLIREGDDQPVIIDWRSPVASLFYQGKLGDASYNVKDNIFDVTILKRMQFIIKKSKLLGLFNSDVDVKDEILQEVLSGNCKDKLKDIVRTIQTEQDRIIRTTPYDTIIVDGVAGSGKTTIALHRIAYLLYNYRKQLENKVLIIGPNEIFMEYISEVLPSLGENNNVEQNTFKQFAMEILDLKNTDIMDFTSYMEKILDKDKTLLDDIRFKTSKEYITFLDNAIQVIEKEHCLCQSIYYLDSEVVSGEEIHELFYKYYINMPLARRIAKIKRIIIGKLHDKRDQVIREINQKYKKISAKLDSEQLSYDNNNIQYKRRLEIRKVIKKLHEVKKVLSRYDIEDITALYNKINLNKQLISDDLAPMLYLKYKLQGYKYENEIKHVVIDEAQDFSALQFKVIKDITNPSAMTILGDSNQRILPNFDNNTLEDIKEILNFKKMEYFKLDKSYRSTKEIMEYANTFLPTVSIVPLVRQGSTVEEKIIDKNDILSDTLIEYIYNAKKKSHETMGIICENIHECNEIYNLIKDKINVNLVDREGKFYKGGVVIMPTYFAKGLEFDEVIAVFKSSNTSQNLLRYITCTRALHDLKVISRK